MCGKSQVRARGGEEKLEQSNKRKPSGNYRLMYGLHKKYIFNYKYISDSWYFLVFTMCDVSR